MKSTVKKATGKRYISNSKGKIEFVVLPLKEYEQVMELLDDYGLGLAIKRAEDCRKFNKKEALKFLENV